MPLTQKGAEILRNMTKNYGEKKGKEVFYASKNAGKISGVDEAKSVGKMVYDCYMARDKARAR